MAGTTWPNLVAGTPARASDVEAKFDWLEGNINPMLAGTQTDATYDLGTSAFRWRDGWFSRDVLIAATGKLRLDGSSGGDTYISESSGNRISVTVGGTEYIAINHGITQVTINSGNFAVLATQKLFIDSGGDTYFQEISANNAVIVTGNVEAVRIDSSQNVGIGIGSPDNRLHVFVASAGAVSSRPEAKLTIENNGDTAFQILSPNTASQYVFFGDADANNVAWIKYDHSLNDFSIRTNSNSNVITVTANGNMVPGTAALATSATDGFIYLQGCAGTPTGTPTTYAGRSPVVVDTSNNIPYFYASGAWRSMGGIIGLKPMAVNTTTSAVTSTAINVVGQGRIKRLWLGGEVSKDSITCQVIVDGNTIFSSNRVGTTNTAGNVTVLIKGGAAFTTGSISGFYYTTSVILNSAGWTSTSDLDIFFKQSLTVFWANGSGAGTITVSMEYEA